MQPLWLQQLRLRPGRLVTDRLQLEEKMIQSISIERLTELERIAAAATPGPLEITEGDCHGSDSDRWSVVKDLGGAKFFVATIENGAPGDTLETEKANAELFAAARTEIPAMVAEIKRLKSFVKLAAEMSVRLAAIREKLETIVCTKDPDEGVVLLSNDGPCHYDPELKAQVYDHQYFSPLGDALIEAWIMTDPEYEGPRK
jgi:hypothetical protein